MNGDLIALRPTARAIAETASKNDPASVRAVVGMCASVDAPLGRIAGLRKELHALDLEPGGPHSYMTDVPSNARWLVDDRYDMCRSDDWRCRDWCVERWKALTAAVRVLDTLAAKHEAHLELLD